MYAKMRRQTPQRHWGLVMEIDRPVGRRSKNDVSDYIWTGTSFPSNFHPGIPWVEHERLAAIRSIASVLDVTLYFKCILHFTRVSVNSRRRRYPSAQHRTGFSRSLHVAFASLSVVPCS
jgi:hypothetical protein